MTANQYTGNPSRVYCNACFHTLTSKELARYPYTWQYSGDMYCMRHETRTQFREEQES